MAEHGAKGQEIINVQTQIGYEMGAQGILGERRTMRRVDAEMDGNGRNPFGLAGDAVCFI